MPASTNMNRPGAVPQSLRGIPGGFGGQQPQQQQQQQGRVVSNRIPNGKIAGNGSGWAFNQVGGGVPLSAGGIQNPSRQLGGGNVSFAQSLSGSSQPATPLDLSEFPSLSNNPQLGNAGQTSMWSTHGRNLGAPLTRNHQPASPSSTQPTQQQDDIFSASSRLSSAQGSFRFGNQGSVSQGPQSQATSVDEFPPLNRNANGDIGQERGTNLMANFGFGSTGAGPSTSGQPSRAGNGLLNALSANSRATDVRSPAAGSQSREGRSSVGDDDMRQKNGPFREDSLASQSSFAGPGSLIDNRNPHGVIGTDPSNGKGKETADNGPSGSQDPLAGLSDKDRWGLKGLRHLMDAHPDYNTLLLGVEPTALGVDLASNELISTSVYSLFSDEPPRPAIPKFRLPECYQVNNVQPIENKIGSFNEETLMWIFYSCPGDRKQQLAAIELNNRNWRWHKKLQFWLTKDDSMIPQVLSPNHERGYYIVWNTDYWRKDRVREFTLHYADLESPPPLLAQ